MNMDSSLPRDIGSFKCDVCNDVFTSSSDLEAHRRDQCLYSTDEESDLEDPDLGEGPQQCTYCPKKFAQGTNLEKHIRTHTEFRPFTCSICEITFTNGENLRMHERSHSR